MRLDEPCPAQGGPHLIQGCCGMESHKILPNSWELFTGHCPTILKNPADSSAGFLSTYFSGLLNHKSHKLWFSVLKTDLC